jgi:Predicted membrane protein
VTGARDLDRTVARLLTAGTYLSVGLLAIGVGLMAIGGVSPLDGGPRFDPAQLPSDLAALKPSGFLWLGLVVALATPLGRVAASLVGYLGGGERRMAAIAVAILIVVFVGVILGVAAQS